MEVSRPGQPAREDSPRGSIRARIGQIIREQREARGFSVTELARRFEDAGSPSRWHDYKGVWALETGKAAIRLEDLEILADVLGVPVELFVTPLLPTGSAISPEEAKERIRLEYRDFLSRASKRVESAISETMDDPEFRKTVGWIAELSTPRRQLVQEVVRGLRRNEGEDRHLARTPAVATVTTVNEPSRSGQPRPATKGQGGPKRKR